MSMSESVLCLAFELLYRRATIVRHQWNLEQTVLMSFCSVSFIRR